MDRDAIVKALVKPLVWRDTKSTNQRHEAVIFEAMYEVCLEDDGLEDDGWFFWNDGDEGYGPYNTLAAAQAAADADYRARIAAALHVEKIAALVEALEPFKAMSGELFARNWNKDDVVIALDNPRDPHRLTFGDFLELHARLAAFRGDATGGEVG